MSLNLKTLEKYHEEGLLYKQKHPNLPLTIWNYTEKVQYEGLWDEITLHCRGLITDEEKVIVQPFKKFFNYEEVIDKSVIPVKGDYVYVQEKMDGSLGILFYYADEWIMATRGSFISDQALRGMEILKSQYTVFDRSFEPSVAYLCEIIYPENRIVVDYNKEKIVFLSAAINWSFRGWKASDEDELHWTTACAYFHMNGIKKSDIVKTEQHFSFSDDLYRSLKEKNEKNKEGFVLRFHPGNFRIKIKFEEYVRLHKIMTNLSTTSVWETLSRGERMEDLLKDVPDEFYKKIKEYENELLREFQSLKSEYEDHFESIKRLGTRKLFAQFARVFAHPNLLFGMLDGKDIDPMIWKIMKPEFRKL
jgi:hypothetical protein